MVQKCVHKVHIKQLMLFWVSEVNNATNNTNAINSVICNHEVRKCQRRFKRFQLGEFVLLDDVRSGSLMKFNKVLRLVAIDADLEQTR